MTDFHRTNINLNTTDVEWLKDKFGYGWTEKVRDIVSNYVAQHKTTKIHWGQDFNLDPEGLPK